MTKETAQFLLSIVSQMTVNPLGEDADKTLTDIRRAHEELMKIVETE
jgi:hypothetical protein